MDWFSKSASKGNAFGQYNLGTTPFPRVHVIHHLVGRLYETGAAGKQDLELAFKYLSLSADQGNSYGQLNLGMFLSLNHFFFCLTCLTFWF